MFRRLQRVVAVSVGVVVVGGLAVPGVASPIPEPHDPGAAITDDSSGRDQHGSPGGHLPESSANVELVGRLRLHDAAPGIIPDVGVLGHTAYLGQFSPGCLPDGGGGVYVVDISDPAAPSEIGFIPTPGTFVGEGVQALRLATPSFTGDLLVVNGESCATIPDRIGGFSLYDVTDPANPVTLVENAGDVNTAGGVTRANQIHSAFAWQQGERAFVVIVDDEEATDVDIFDITDPANPVFIAETGLDDWPGAQDAQSAGIGAFAASFFHDVVVKQVRDHWLMLLSYWDAGYIVVNVDDPAHPVFVDDTTFTDPDPETGLGPEGNGHQAEWNSNSQYFLGSDEDFSPTEITSFTSNAFEGPRPATEGAFTVNIATLPDATMSDEVVHVGRGCPPGTPGLPPAGDPYLADPTGKIALIQRGACRFDNKIAWAQLNGAVGAIVYNNVGGILTMGGSNPVNAGSATVIGTVITIPGVLVEQSTGQLLAGGTPPVTAAATAEFNGWGYVHLFDARSLREIDTFAIPEALDPAFLRTADNPFGFGNLTNHEIATSRHPQLAYLSWYAGGFRVIRYDRHGIREIGHYIDPGGNDFWGVQTFVDDLGRELVAASDRDDGLWIFRYTGVPQP